SGHKKIAPKSGPCREATYVREQSACVGNDMLWLDRAAKCHPHRSVCPAGNSRRHRHRRHRCRGIGTRSWVWVIAETTDLPTKFARIVVTDDYGRYLVPELPSANYTVWVRGYGLVDSAKLAAKPGQLLDHTAVPAPNEPAAAHHYPAIY